MTLTIYDHKSVHKFLVDPLADQLKYTEKGHNLKNPYHWQMNTN